MIKPKKKKSPEALGTAASAVHTAEEKPKKAGRPVPDAAASSRPKKRAKTSSAVTNGNSEAPTGGASSVTGKIQIGGGAVDCCGLDRALKALCRHVQKLQAEEETPDLLVGSGGPTVCLMFSLQNIPDRQRVIPHLM